MGTTRSLTIALRVDSGGMDAGIQHALAQNRQFAAEVGRINQNLADSRARYAAAKASGASPEVLSARKAELDASRQSMAVAMADAKLRASLEDTVFRATHSSLEIQLRDRQNYYTRLRTMHAGNTNMLLQIDRAYQVEVGAINRQIAQQAVASAAMAAPGGGGMINALGGKRLVKQELKYAAGTGLGMHGGEVGMAIMAGLSMAPAAGAVVGGLILLGSTYKAAKDSAQALVEKQERHADAVRESVKWSRQLADSLNTATGRKMEGRADELEEQARKIERESKKNIREKGMSDYLWAGMQRLTTGKDDLTQGVLEDIQQYQEAMNEAALRRGQAHDQQRLARQRDLEDAQAATKSSEIATMEDGPAKRRAELEHRQTQEELKAQREDSDRIAAMKQDLSEGAEARLKEEQDRQNRSHTERMRQRLNQDKALVLQEQRERRQDQASAEDAHIAATMDGYAREEALLRSKHTRERDERFRAGSFSIALIARQQDEEEALRHKRARAIADMQQDMETAAAVAVGSKTSTEAEWEGRARQLSREYSLTADELERMHQAFIAMKQAQADKGLLDNAREIDIALDRVNRKISEQEAIRRRLQLANPEASGDAIDKAAKAQEKLAVTQWAKGQLPVEQFKDYREQLDRAIEMGVMGKSAAAGLLQKKMNELMGGGGPGRFTDSASHWRDVQSSLIRKDDLPRLTVEELKAIREEISRLRREGSPLKG